MANFTDSPVLGYRFTWALEFVSNHHIAQVRKNGVPYISHLLSVAALVLEAGGSEDEAIAALLHDAIEDVGVSDKEIYDRWGAYVSAIVCRVTENKNLPVEDRKAVYVEQLKDASESSSILVSCADKLHNLRSYYTDGRNLWKSETANFYRELMKIYIDCDRIPTHWIQEMTTKIYRLDVEVLEL